MKKYLLLALLSISTAQAARVPIFITRPVKGNPNIVVETYYKKKKYGNYHSVVYDATKPRAILFRQDSDSRKLSRLLITHQIVENWTTVIFRAQRLPVEEGYISQDFSESEDGSIVELISPKPKRHIPMLDILLEKIDN